MSGKYTKKKGKSGIGRVLILLLIVAGLFAALWAAASGRGEDMPLPTEPAASTVPVESTQNTTQDATEPPYTFEQEVEGVTSFTLEQGLEITRYGKYIGVYMEDGSDEFVSNVMMIEVRNTTDQAIQYAKITLTGPAGDAVFILTTLMPGQRMIVLEANRKAYSETDVFTEAKLDNLALFEEVPGLLEDQIQIQPLEGGFNITNISGADISGTIEIYFKDMAGEMLYGGITYVCRVQEGLAAGEVKQIMSANFTEDGSCVVFVRIKP